MKTDRGESKAVQTEPGTSPRPVEDPKGQSLEQYTHLQPGAVPPETPNETDAPASALDTNGATENAGTASEDTPADLPPSDAATENVLSAGHAFAPDADLIVIDLLAATGLSEDAGALIHSLSQRVGTPLAFEVQDGGLVIDAGSLPTLREGENATFLFDLTFGSNEALKSNAITLSFKGNPEGGPPADWEVSSVPADSAAAGAVDAQLFIPEQGGLLAKLSSDLAALALEGAQPLSETQEEAVAAGAAEDVGLSGISLMTRVGGFVAIDAVAADGDGAAFQAKLEALGLVKGANLGAFASGLIPIESLGDVAAMEDLAFARPSYTAYDQGSVTSQGDASMNADEARSFYGTDGSGVKIGILSDSFNALGGYGSNIATGDLPAGVTVLDEYFGGDAIDEGRAMAQLIHDVAPGADLSFHTAFGGIANFAQGILDLRDDGASVIVDDIIYFAEPMFQDGAIAQAVNEVVGDGLAYFSSAGNQGQESHQNTFRDSGVSNGTHVFHDFNGAAATDTFMRLTLAPGERALLVLQWDQPYKSEAPGSAGAQNDLDLFVTNATGSTVYSSSTTSNLGGDPFEIAGVINNGGSTASAFVRVGLKSGAAPGLLKVVAFGGNLAEYTTGDGTIYGHAAADGAMAVAAAGFFDTPEFGTTPPEAEWFSSAGPVTILFDENGNRLATPEIRDKADITAPDGTNNTFFGSDSARDPDNLPNFFGTSAAAPHAAAAVALLKSLLPGATPDQLYQALKDGAIDMDAPGWDPTTGFGLVQADATIAEAAISGSAAADNLTGTSLADLIFGFDGDDILIGLGGPDSLVGGIGADTFRGSVSHLDGDAILDFTETDEIEVQGAAFDKSDIQTQQSGGDTILSIDSDGNGSNDLTIALRGNIEGPFVARTNSGNTIIEIDDGTGTGEPPFDIQISSDTFDENAAFTVTLTATDPDTPAGDIAYGLVNDPSGSFQVTGNQLNLVSPLDFEDLPAGFIDQGNGTATVDVVVSASDGVNPAYEEILTLTVNDVEPEGGGGGNIFVFDPSVSDFDGDANIQLSAIGGDLTYLRYLDAVGVNQEGGGVVSGGDWRDQVSKPSEGIQIDFTSPSIESVGIEFKRLAASENVTARVEDAGVGLLGDVTILGQGNQRSIFTATIGQDDLDTTGDIARVTLTGRYFAWIVGSITAKESGSGGSEDSPPTDMQISSDSFDENAAFVATLTATDPDTPAGSIAYGLVNDPSGAFQVTGNQLSLVSPLDFEDLPAGFIDQGNGTATLSVVVSASDGVNPAYEETLTLTVNDVEPEGGGGNTFVFDPSDADFDGDANIQVSAIGGDLTYLQYLDAVGVNQEGGGVVSGGDWRDQVSKPSEGIQIDFASSSIETVEIDIKKLAAGENLTAQIEDAVGTVLGTVTILGQGSQSSAFTATIGQGDLDTPSDIARITLAGRYFAWALDKITATEIGSQPSGLLTAADVLDSPARTISFDLNEFGALTRVATSQSDDLSGSGGEDQAVPSTLPAPLESIAADVLSFETDETTVTATIS